MSRALAAALAVAVALPLAHRAAVPEATAQPAVSRPRVAVVVDLVASVAPERASALGQALADALARELDVDTIGGGDVERRLPGGAVPEDCLAAPACLADLGARLDAGQLLLLSLAQVGDQLRLDATWVDVATGEVVSRPRVELDADVRAPEVFAAAAPRLLPNAARRADQVDVPPPAPRRRMTPLTWSLAGGSALALAGGVALGLSARGTYDRCERDPDGCDQDTRDGIGRRALVADVLMGVAVVGAVTTTILYLRSAERPEAQPPARSWLLAPTRDGALAGVRVSF